MKTIIQHTRTIPADLETPVGVYLKVRDLYPQSALLESSDYHASQNAVSFIGVEPIGSFKVENEQVVLRYPEEEEIRKDIADGAVDVVEELRGYIGSFRVEGTADSRISNGFLGYTAYDAVRYFENVAIRPRETRFCDVPDMYYVLYRYLIQVDHYKNEMTIVENCPEGTVSGTDELIAVLHNNNMAQYPFKAADDLESSMSDEDFISAVKRCVGHSLRGDVFQIVPSRRFSRGFSGDEFNVYRALRCINPSPYLFYFDFGNFKVFGSSPETHLRICGKTAYIDPIAGTFRRTGDEERDRRLADELLTDEKENAEHIMLVDLARNDLSRSGGKVEIEFLKQIQYYSHVIHMVSRVKAELPEGVNQYRLFADSFPAGTLSGAPKVRAMQIIDAVEPHSRLLYGGCIGYLGFNGDINQAITIRSFLSHGGRLYCQAGAGIVARSRAESELQETRNKLGALSKAITYAEEFGK
ncbi:MAG: anthranilate synthase component I family protein [Duncaniella sp.]|uniref:anthranilate synthase component I family protein n=1 Tax=Duncaniella sp. TaxID=2518496 RepID=UPI0023D04D92|nr:anthranilate synthase component I family protein [Duncaniella sp.]MDE5988649.1 anthranilate synthase component I family protein [Duncaniella sp.]